MKRELARRTLPGFLLVLLAGALVFPFASGAQDRLKAMPGYERYQKMSREMGGAVKPGALNVKWLEGGRAFEFQRDGKTYRYDIAARQAVEAQPSTSAEPELAGRGGRRGLPGLERGRQLASVASPDGKLKASYRDRNLWLGDASGASEVAITTEGNEKARIKYGTASWVYGEELNQTTAMWWSPDSKKIAFYRFDESGVTDFYLQLDQTKLVSRADIEGLPKGRRAQSCG